MVDMFALTEWSLVWNTETISKIVFDRLNLRMSSTLLCSKHNSLLWFNNTEKNNFKQKVSTFIDPHSLRCYLENFHWSNMRDLQHFIVKLWTKSWKRLSMMFDKHNAYERREKISEGHKHMWLLDDVHISEYFFITK